MFLFLGITLLLLGACGGGDGETDSYLILRVAEPLDRHEAADYGLPAFAGQPAEDRPLAPLVLPVHPFMDPDGDARIHNDSYNSGVYNRPGVRGRDVAVTTTGVGSWLVGICATLAFTADGQVVGSCIDGEHIWLMLWDPETLDLLAEQNLGPRPMVTNSAGGAYFTMDADGRILIGPGSNHVERYALHTVDGYAVFEREASVNMSDQLPADSLLQDTVVDWQGRTWFTATTGEVGHLDLDTGEVTMGHLGEELQNSMAVDGEAIYVLTYEALYRVSADTTGEVEVDWRAPYDPGSAVQGVLPGSGTTPTLLGEADDLIAICDNADDQIHLLVYDRHQPDPPVCEIPLFRPGESATENSVVGYGDEILVVNNAGFGGPFAASNEVLPGLERYRVRADRSGCDLVWRNDDAILNSVQLSTTTGLIYGYGADPEATGVDAYYLLAHDWETGAEVFRVYAGDNQPFNPVLGQPHLHPSGRVFMGTFNGIVMFADAP